MAPRIISYLRCSDCGKVTAIEAGTRGLSHHCPTTGTVKTVRPDGSRVSDEEMDPRTLGFRYRPATSSGPTRP